MIFLFVFVQLLVEPANFQVLEVVGESSAQQTLPMGYLFVLYQLFCLLFGKLCGLHPLQAVDCPVALPFSLLC